MLVRIHCARAGARARPGAAARRQPDEGAIWFKGTWANPFDRKSTHDAPFTLPSGELAKLLQAAEQADGEEDPRYGKGRRGDELPTELQRAETRRARIRQLKAELEAEA